MNYDGTFEQLASAIGAITSIASTEQRDAHHTVFRTADGIVVNWHQRQKRLHVQGKKESVSRFVSGLAEALAAGSASLLLSDQTKLLAATDASARLGMPPLAARPAGQKRETERSSTAGEAEQAGPARGFSYRRRKTTSESPALASYTPDKDSELVIALVAAVGTDLSSITSILTSRLKTFNYRSKEIRISSDIISEFRSIPDAPEFDRINALMTEGNAFRKNTGDFSILAKLAAAKINEIRQQGKTPGALAPMPRQAFIISSLKHPAEVAALRKIYANGFYLIGVHANKETRFEYLNQNKKISESEVKQLFERDQDEAEKHGQHTRDTYHLSDFFVDFGENRHKFEKDVWRFLDLIFGKPFVTPTFDEFAMFMAFSASLRSAELSRQVGAVVTKDHAIVSTGANDVPKFGGGLYWPDYYGGAGIHDLPNGRDYIRSGDTNVIERNDIIDDILSKFPDEQKVAAREILANSKLKNITEYGRVVHAEMEAILSCARGNVGTRGAHLYCTTFPCHNCAKHVIAAGITKVIYVEPYPKSKAAVFHDDAITLAPLENQKVVFSPFVGVGPRSFFNLFSMNLGTGYEIVRKNTDGKPVKWEEHQATLRMQMRPISYLERESITTNQVNKLLESLK